VPRGNTPYDGLREAPPKRDTFSGFTYLKGYGFRESKHDFYKRFLGKIIIQLSIQKGFERGPIFQWKVCERIPFRSKNGR